MIPPGLPPSDGGDDANITNRPPADRYSDGDFGGGPPPLGDDRREDLIDRIRRPPLGWWDHQFKTTPMWLLVAVALCCGISCIGLAFGIGGLVFCQDPEARQRAKTFMVIAVIGLLLRIGLAAVVDTAQPP
jgi:hypothetical protein